MSTTGAELLSGVGATYAEDEVGVGSGAAGWKNCAGGCASGAAEDGAAATGAALDDASTELGAAAASVGATYPSETQMVVV